MRKMIGSSPSTTLHDIIIGLQEIIMKSLSLHIGGVHQAIQETGNTVLACREEQSAEHRRTSPRKQVSLRVDYADAQGRAWWGVARNLSYGGIFLEYPPGLSVGDTITLTFVLPTGQPCKCQAQVVYLNTVGAGLRFTDRQAPLEVASIEHLKTSGQEE